MRGLILAACSLGLVAAPAAALDMPARKPGLWQISMSVDGRTMPGQASKHCIDAATDKQMSAMGSSMQQDMCPKQDIRRAGDTIIIDSTCKIGAMTTTSHAVVSGDFNSAYTMQVDSKSEGGPAIPGMPAGGNSKMTIAAKWMGPCEAGQKPGDIIMSNGMKMNISDMQSMQRGGAPALPKR